MYLWLTSVKSSPSFWTLKHKKTPDNPKAPKSTTLKVCSYVFRYPSGIALLTSIHLFHDTVLEMYVYYCSIICSITALFMLTPILHPLRLWVLFPHHVPGLNTGRPSNLFVKPPGFKYSRAYVQKSLKILQNTLCLSPLWP